MNDTRLSDAEALHLKQLLDRVERQARNGADKYVSLAPDASRHLAEIAYHARFISAWCDAFLAEAGA